MKRILFLIILSLSLSFVSCNRKRIEYQMPIFDSIEQVTLENIGSPSEDQITIVGKFNNQFICAYPHLNKKCYHVHNVSDIGYNTSFGDIGSSQYELLKYWNMSAHIRDNKLIVPISQTPRILEYNLSNLDSIDVTCKNLNTVLDVLDIYSTDSGQYIATYKDGYRIILYDDEFNILDTCNYFSPLEHIQKDFKEDKRYSKKYNQYMSCSRIDFSPNGKYMMSILYNDAVYELFKVEDDKIVPITTKYFYSSYLNSDNILRGSSDPLYVVGSYYLTDKNIYFTIRRTTDPMNRYIKVMDWEGNLCKEYDLGVPIKSFYIDEENSIGYVFYELKDEQRQFAKFSL